MAWQGHALLTLRPRGDGPSSAAIVVNNNAANDPNLRCPFMAAPLCWYVMPCLRTQR